MWWEIKYIFHCSRFYFPCYQQEIRLNNYSNTYTVGIAKTDKTLHDFDTIQKSIQFCINR